MRASRGCTARRTTTLLSDCSGVLYRDVTELVRRDLVERTPAGVRAKKELILAFLPWRKEA